jgi:Tol biopolymer transport system component
VAHPFDPSRLQTTGPPLTVVEPVAGATSGFPAFSAARSGVLAYSVGLLAQTELWKVERSGTRTVRLAPAADYVDATLSPDGQRLAFSRTTESWQEPDIFLLDLKRGSEARLTTDPATETTPLWSPKGDRIIFRANRQSVILALWSVEPSPGSLPEPIFSTEQQRRAHGDVARNIHSTDWTRDGKFLVYHRPDEDSGYDISAVTLDGEGRVVPVTRSRHNEMQGAVSPDCAWIAFASDESGRLEVYLQSFPDASASPRIPISVGGGLQPHWSPDGRELYYLRSDGVLMAVQMQIGPKGLDVGASTPLFQTNLPTAMNAYRSDYAVSPDGKGFVMKVPAEGARPPTINVVLNWPTLLRK